MPSPVFWFQRTWPVFRSIQSACRVFELWFGVETKMRSPQMTGVEAPGPGMSVLQRAVSFVHMEGKSRSSDDPLKCGPRHCGQFPATADPTRVNQAIMVNNRASVIGVVYLGVRAKHQRLLSVRMNSSSLAAAREALVGSLIEFVASISNVGAARSTNTSPAW